MWQQPSGLLAYHGIRPDTIFENQRKEVVEKAQCTECQILRHTLAHAVSPAPPAVYELCSSEGTAWPAPPELAGNMHVPQHHTVNIIQ